MPKMLCNDVIGKYLGAITQGILNDKSPQEICVKIRMCRAKIGECGGDSRDSLLEGPGPVPECAAFLAGNPGVTARVHPWSARHWSE